MNLINFAIFKAKLKWLRNSKPQMRLGTIKEMSKKTSKINHPRCLPKKMIHKRKILKRVMPKKMSLRKMKTKKNRNLEMRMEMRLKRLMPPMRKSNHKNLRSLKSNSLFIIGQQKLLDTLRTSLMEAYFAPSSL